MSFLIVFGLFASTSTQAHNNSQALSQSELNRINNQPLAPAVSTTGAMNTPETRKPNYQYKDKNDTTVTEDKDVNAPTQVDVKTPYTSYEMAPPTSVMPGPPKETDLISVPSISIPLR
ncbi:hypothetical protein [Polynucleobacter necessarius]|uniref:hypothetical protein n=1 Tax=Polynucleobacter necessarius TaxID=576610 RepID=UPI001E55B4A6|nr:hypothetical protein [Polynucleobacter necessarius]